MSSTSWYYNSEKHDYRRRIDPDEAIFTDFNIVADGPGWTYYWVNVEFEESNIETTKSRLKTAWLKLLIENPTLYARFESYLNSEKPEVIIKPIDTEEKLIEWGDKTFIIDENSKIVEDAFVNECTTDIPMRLTYLVQCGVVLIQGKHEITDAYGLSLAFNSLFENYGANQPYTDIIITQEKKNLFDPKRLEKVSGISFLLGADKKVFNTQQDVDNDSLLKKPDYVNEREKAEFDYDEDDAEKKNCELTNNSLYSTITCDKEHTKKIIQRAKELNTTVGTIIYAAILTVVSKSKNNVGKVLNANTVYSLRHKSSSPINPLGLQVIDHNHPFILYDNFGKNLDQIKEYFNHWKPLFKDSTVESIDQLSSCYAAKVHGKKNFKQQLEQMAKIDPRDMFAVTYSTLGDITDTYLKPIYPGVLVKEISMAVRNNLPFASIITYTFNGKLNSTISFGKFFKTQTMETFNADVLTQCLGNV